MNVLFPYLYDVIFMEVSTGAVLVFAYGTLHLFLYRLVLSILWCQVYQHGTLACLKGATSSC